MLHFFAMAVCTNAFPQDIANKMLKSQWVQSTNHATSPCMAIDAYVRFYYGTLVVNLIGFCDRLSADNAVCEFRSQRGEVDTQRAKKFLRAPSSETRGGYVSSLLLAKSQFDRILLWDAMYLDCGTPPFEKGEVTVSFDSTRIEGIKFETPNRTVGVGDIAVCTRLYDIKTWRPWNTVKFIEWINWNSAIGVSVIHIYVHSMRSDDVWQVLRHYENESQLVLHDWSDKASYGAVTKGWEMTQVPHVADCFLRLEGKYRFVGAIDHDEFININDNKTERLKEKFGQPTSSLLSLLDEVYQENPHASNVVYFDPYAVQAKLCDKAEETLRVSVLCNACDNSFGSWTKYFIRSNKEHPLELLPYIHTANDGRQPHRFNKDVAWLMHVNQDTNSNAKCPAPLTVVWNSFSSHVAWMYIQLNPTVSNVYSAAINRRRMFKTFSSLSTPTVSQRRCFKFIDVGAGVGSSMLKVAYPSEHKDSALAREVEMRNFARFRCRQFWAFEANPVSLGQLQEVCVGLMRNNVTCSSNHALLGTTDGLQEIYLDNNQKFNVNVFSLNRFLRSTVSGYDLVMIKLDIEGIEYDVVYELAVDETACAMVDVLAIEWHGMLVFGTDTEQREKMERKYNKTVEELESFIVDRLDRCGVEVLTYNGATN